MAQRGPGTCSQAVLQNLTAEYDYLAHPGLMTSEQVQVQPFRASGCPEVFGFIFLCISFEAPTCLVCSLGMVIFECCEGPSDALHHIHCASGPEGAAIGSGGLLSNTVPWQLQSSSLMAY